MFLYLIDYWVPFPSSEYGGVVCVVAKDDDDCVDVLFKEYETEEEGMWLVAGGHKEEIKENIKSAQKYEVTNCDHMSKIVKEFTT